MLRVFNRKSYKKQPDSARPLQATLNDKIRQDADNGIVELALSDDLNFLLSSGDYADLVGAVLGPPDVLLTWTARYPSVIESIFAGSGRMGPVIDCAAQNWPVALLLYVMVAGAAAYNFYHQYQAKKAAHDDKLNTHRKINQRLRAVTTPEADPEAKVAAVAPNLGDQLAELNETLATIVQEEGSEKYEKIEIINSSASAGKQAFKVRYVFKKKAKPENPEESKESAKAELADEVAKPSRWKRFVNKVLHPIYTSTTLAAFSYWILFIATSLAVGNFADAGIAGLSPVFAFGIPIAAALIYPIMKVHNWYLNKGHVSDEHARLTKIADTDTPALLKKALHRIEFNREVKRLETERAQMSAQLSEQELKSIPTNDVTSFSREPLKAIADDSCSSDPRTQAAAALYTGFVSQYGLAQYHAWVISDFLKVAGSVAFAPFLGPVFGGILLAFGIGMGLKEMYQRFKAVKKEDANKVHGPAMSLETLFEMKRNELFLLRSQQSALTSEISENRGFLRENANSVASVAIPTIVGRPVPDAPKPTSWPRSIYNAFDWTATGAFFGRLIVTTAAIFTVGIIAAGSFASLAVLATTGLVFLGLKIYQASQKKKEDDAKEYIAKIKDMDEQIHLTKMTNDNLTLENQLLRKQQPVLAHSLDLLTSHQPGVQPKPAVSQSLSAESKQQIEPSAGAVIIPQSANDRRHHRSESHLLSGGSQSFGFSQAAGARPRAATKRSWLLGDEVDFDHREEEVPLMPLSSGNSSSL